MNIAEKQIERDANMKEHLQEMEALFERSSSLGDDMSEDRKICCILKSVKPYYEDLVNILLSWPDDKVDLREIQGKLIDEWQKRYRNSGNQMEDMGLMMRSNNVTCHKCKRSGHIQRFCPDNPYTKKPKYQSNSSGTQNYDYGKKSIHSRLGPTTNKFHQHAKHAEDNEENSDSDCETKQEIKTSFSAREDRMKRWGQLYAMTLNDETSKNDNSWVIDSGATSHMCKNQKMMFDIDYSKNGNIKIFSWPTVIK